MGGCHGEVGSRRLFLETQFILVTDGSCHFSYSSYSKPTKISRMVTSPIAGSIAFLNFFDISRKLLKFSRNNFFSKKSRRLEIDSDDRGHQRASSDVPHDPPCPLGTETESEHVSGWVVAMVTLGSRRLFLATDIFSNIYIYIVTTDTRGPGCHGNQGYF
jgi:hypothetical protein